MYADDFIHVQIQTNRNGYRSRITRRGRPIWIGATYATKEEAEQDARRFLGQTETE